MNSNDLLVKVYNVMKTSGLIDEITDWMKEHPESFKTIDDSLINGLQLDISYQPKSLSDIQSIKEPCLTSVEIGCGMLIHEFTVFDTGRYEHRTWSRNDLSCVSRITKEVKDVQE